MKRIILAFACLAFLASCKKDEASKLQCQFSGKWEFVQFVGYPFTFPALPPGNGRIIVLGENGSFQRFADDTLIFKGSYFLQKKKDCYQAEPQFFFKTNDRSFANNNAISLEAERLIFSTSSCLIDGGVSVYRRIP